MRLKTWVKTNWKLLIPSFIFACAIQCFALLYLIDSPLMWIFLAPGIYLLYAGIDFIGWIKGMSASITATDAIAGMSDNFAISFFIIGLLVNIFVWTWLIHSGLAFVFKKLRA